MRRNLAEPFATDQSNKLVARKQILDRPDAGISRFQHVPFLGTHYKANTTSADTLGSPDMTDEKFGYVDFQHSHSGASLGCTDFAKVPLYPASGLFLSCPPPRVAQKHNLLQPQISREAI